MNLRTLYLTLALVSAGLTVGACAAVPWSKLWAGVRGAVCSSVTHDAGPADGGAP